MNEPPKFLLYAVEDFYFLRMPSRRGFMRVGEPPSAEHPKGRGLYVPNEDSDTEKSYAERARLMRVRLGLEKPALRVVK
jgi:hypothetical protein